MKRLDTSIYTGRTLRWAASGGVRAPRRGSSQGGEGRAGTQWRRCFLRGRAAQNFLHIDISSFLVTLVKFNIRISRECSMLPPRTLHGRRGVGRGPWVSLAVSALRLRLHHPSCRPPSLSSSALEGCGRHVPNVVCSRCLCWCLSLVLAGHAHVRGQRVEAGGGGAAACAMRCRQHAGPAVSDHAAATRTRSI